MRTLLASALLGSTLITTNASAAAVKIPPVLTGSPSAAAITQRCNLFVNAIGAERKVLEGTAGPKGIAALRAYDHIYDILGAASGEATLFREVATSDEARKAGQECEVRLSAEGTKIGLSRPIYDRLKAIDADAQDAQTRFYLARALGDFERSGVALDEAGRAKAQKISDEISSLEAQFAANIAKGRRTVSAVPAELDGLPADFIAAHKPGADGKVSLSTDYTDYIPVMTYAKNGDLRRRMYIEFNQRAYPENDAVFRNLLAKRNELVALLGRKNYAALTLENRMLNTPENVQAFMDEQAAAARPAALRDLAKKQAMLQQLQPGAAKINPWDSGYLSQLVQKQSYGYDRQEARKYFAYDNVRDGILRLTREMFGVEIRPWNTPVWDKLVEPYEMYENGKLIGRFYLDSHPRPGKYNHANQIALRSGRQPGSVPMGALVMNLPAGGHDTGLMEHDDVVTFLHEYGHLLHHIFGSQKQKWSYQSGVANEWDFVEAPSQMLENWVYDYDTLKTFAVDADGKVIPRELVDQMNRARFFDEGIGDMRQIGLSNIALQYNLGTIPADLGAAARAADAKYALIPMAPESQMQASFGHLGSSGYGAAYYTYNWSKVIADDLFTRFEQKGLRDAETARQYRELVLAPGGSRPSAELVQSFLGRPISLDAYRAKMEKDQ
ncbi:Zn-dependent oligopeptidase [Sphingomonas piscis]|uniref:Zn-dependent oligopeptidase n=1 Tax=Sphingomonas piscis TaxID=2714943 RepID=A0A6G7YN93_9SPHN|nr:M3 family metallopeptidase [Sphingomonas piscis]QIK78215.1 Zn-dependent oligopeptidase [Sphingomonas piscis]